jgi:beta-lactamase regulating signal transducer with metallopeptidase domain
MSKKDYLNFPDSASTPSLNKKSTTLLLGSLVERLSNLERIQKSGRSFHTLIASITVAQSIALVILGIVVYRTQKKTFTFQTVPSIPEERLEMQRVNGEIGLVNTDM